MKLKSASCLIVDDDPISPSLLRKDEPLWDQPQFCGVLSDDAALIADVVTVARTSVIEGVNELKIAIGANDAKIAARLLHRMKGTFENLYATSLVTLTRQLEATLKNGQTLTAADIGYFEKQVLKLKALFDDYLATQSKNG